MRTMQRWMMVTAVAAGMAMMVGCEKPAQVKTSDETTGGGHAAVAKSGPLALGIRLPGGMTLTQGQVAEVKIFLANNSDQPVEIEGELGAKIRVELEVYRDGGWQHVKQWPGTEQPVRQLRTIKPNEFWSTDMNLPVTLDWPTGEELRFVAYPTGKKDLKVTLPAEVIISKK